MQTLWFQPIKEKKIYYTLNTLTLVQWGAQQYIELDEKENMKVSKLLLCQSLDGVENFFGGELLPTYDDKKANTSKKDRIWHKRELKKEKN